jgi:hypothetical protein
LAAVHTASPAEPTPSESRAPTPSISGGPDACARSQRATSSSDDQVNAELAERVLRGELDESRPQFQPHFLSAAFDADPSRQLRALSQLDAADDTVAETLIRVATTPFRADVRYEALKRLHYAGRDGRIDAQTRRQIFADYELLVIALGGRR